ncbi:MAG TPA: hypothetical protein VME23_20625 [Terracidiphilus sp.]|nr:hypothetical protein [Terracidiphilus sp.]
MKKLFAICAVLAMTLCAGKAMAADVTGSWTTQMQTMNGDTATITFNFKQDGANLTGTVAGPMGDPMPITNGKVDGDKFTFDVSFNGITIHHNCTVDGETIKMSTKTDSGDFPAMELTLTRVKADAPAAPAAPTGAAATPQPQLF